MATCEHCDRETTTAASCRPWAVRTARGDLPTLRLGRERVHVVGLEDLWEEDLDELDELDELHELDGLDGAGAYDPHRPGRRARPRPRRTPALVRVPLPRRCGDCGTLPGGYHHPGCDAAECPACGHQLFTCGCAEDEPVPLDGARAL
ncbi:hypothetical protein [Vallicoccus soli]|nr:hypothetical protein [Vallicoccus soli]